MLVSASSRAGTSDCVSVMRPPASASWHQAHGADDSVMHDHSQAAAAAWRKGSAAERVRLWGSLRGETPQLIIGAEDRIPEAQWYSIPPDPIGCCLRREERQRTLTLCQAIP